MKFCLRFNCQKICGKELENQNKFCVKYLLIKHETHAIEAKTHTELNENFDR